MAYSKQTWDTTSYVNPTRMNHIEDGIEATDLTSGGTIVGNLTVNAQNGTTSAEGRSRLSVGNAIASGTDGNSYGMLTLFAKNTQHINISTVDSPTASRNIFLPDKAGTIALTSDLTTTESTSIQFTNSKCNPVYPIECKRNGNVVNISTIINPTSNISANEILATLPEGYRPSNNFAYFTASQNVVIQARSNGELKVSDISATITSGYYGINLTFVI